MWVGGLAGGLGSGKSGAPPPPAELDGPKGACSHINTPLWGGATGGPGANQYDTLSQTVTANAGDTLSFDVFFATTDYSPYNDDGYVKFGSTVLYSNSVFGVGDFGHAPWKHVVTTIGTSGTYTFEAGVRNLIDNVVPSYLGVDNVTLTSVPEPGTMTLAGIGLVSVLGYRLRRRQAA